MKNLIMYTQKQFALENEDELSQQIYWRILCVSETKKILIIECYADIST